MYVEVLKVGSTEEVARGEEAEVWVLTLIDELFGLLTAVLPILHAMVILLDRSPSLVG